MADAFRRAVEHRDTLARLTRERNAITCEFESVDEKDERGFWIGTGELACWRHRREVERQNDDKMAAMIGAPEPLPDLCESCQRREAMSADIRALRARTGGINAALWRALRAGVHRG